MASVLKSTPEISETKMPLGLLRGIRTSIL